MNYVVILFGFILSCTLYAPVQLLGPYKLIRAKVSYENRVSPDVVYSDNASLSKDDKGVFTIFTANDEQIFHSEDFITMIEKYVEFEVSHPNNMRIHCLFRNPKDAQEILKDFKLERTIATSDASFSLLMVYLADRFDDRIYSPPNRFSIAMPTIIVQRNRFICLSRDNSPEMLFTENNFNVSQVLTLGHLVLTIQIKDILIEDTIMVKFELFFGREPSARGFYDFVKTPPDHHTYTNDRIPVDIPDSLARLNIKPV